MLKSQWCSHTCHSSQSGLPHLSQLTEWSPTLVTAHRVVSHICHSSQSGLPHLSQSTLLKSIAANCITAGRGLTLHNGSHHSGRVVAAIEARDKDGTHSQFLPSLLPQCHKNRNSFLIIINNCTNQCDAT